MNDRPRFRITLEALGHPEGVPAINRLRMLLKRALRALHLKCVEAIEVKPEAARGGEADDVEENP